MNLIFASQNPNKIAEIQDMLPAGFTVEGINDLISEELEETGDTLEANALQKARFIAMKTGRPVFADDTGMEVEALNGAPGVYSARYAGPEKDALKNMEKILAEMNETDNRRARFRTVIAFCNGKDERLFEGIVNGVISLVPAGKNGFGYDPIFVPDGYCATFAEMKSEEKNKISHRGKAFEAFVRFLESEWK